MMADDPEHPDLFLLTDSEKGERLDRLGSKVLQTLTPDPDLGSVLSAEKYLRHCICWEDFYSTLCFKL